MIDWTETIIQRCIVIGARNIERYRDKKDGLETWEKKTKAIDREIRELAGIFKLREQGNEHRLP